MHDGTQFIVILHLADSKPERLISLVPNLQSVLEYVSTEPYQQVYRSVMADTFAYFIRSKMKARTICDFIQAPKTNTYDNRRPLNIDPFLRNGDGVFALEVGDDKSCVGSFTRAWAWLQHH